MNTGSREDVATFAAWCVGSCHGDDDQRVELVRTRVMNDGQVFAYWKAEHARYIASRAEGVFVGNDGTPFESWMQEKGIAYSRGPKLV